MSARDDPKLGPSPSPSNICKHKQDIVVVYLNNCQIQFYIYYEHSKDPNCIILRNYNEVKILHTQLNCYIRTIRVSSRLYYEEEILFILITNCSKLILLKA